MRPPPCQPTIRRASMGNHPTIESTIPARLDRLPWSAWHWRVVIALGVSWLLDGLEVTVVGSLGPALQRDDTLGLTAAQIGWAASAYIAGAVLGALFFGRLADRLGRKRMFLVTLVVYLIATVATAFSWDILSFAFCRFMTGFGIGGEYAAINSAIDELIPARVRGQVNLGINGSYWIGTALGSVATLWLLDPQFFPIDLGWRAGFFIGALLGFVVLLACRYVPESPRWLTIHGQHDKAMRIVASIESRVVKGSEGTRVPPADFLVIHPRTHIGCAGILPTLVPRYLARPSNRRRPRRPGRAGR